MKKYQEGGLAAAQPQQVDPTAGYLSLLAQPFQTTPEAQEEARKILAALETSDLSAGDAELQERFRESAEQSRMALREAREKVLARKYDKRRMWLAAAGALGAPTRTGSFGESIGALGRALEPQFAARDQFDIDQEKELLGIDQALSGVDRTLLESDASLQELRRKTQDGSGEDSIERLG